MRKIGIFVGTFNPLHFGHIHLALALKESRSLDEVFFSPNHTSPFPVKEESFIPAEKRFEMLCLGLEGVPGCSALDYEVKRPGPSYTIDLIRYARSSLCKEGDQLFLLLGEDLLAGFPGWKEKEELLSLAEPLVGSRKVLTEKLVLSPELKKKFETGSVLIPILEISSSLIRDRLKKGLYCTHLVPQKVLDYILSNKLYL